MELDDLVPDEEKIEERKSFRSGLISKKKIGLTKEKIIEFRDGIITSRYQVINREKILSTKLDYSIPKKPFLLGIALFIAGANIDRIELIKSQYPLVSAVMMLIGGISFLYGIVTIRKEHLIQTDNPEVSLSLPSGDESTEILNKITEDL